MLGYLKYVCTAIEHVTWNVCDPQCDVNGIYRQLKKKKEFTGGAVFKPLQAEVIGQMTLGDYRGVVSRDRQVDELRLIGLTDDEIQLKLTHDDNDVIVGDNFEAYK